MSNFFVVGLPRSRTAWLANFLTYEDKFCFHEGINGCSTLKEYKNKLGNNKGDSCIETDTKRAIEFSKEIYGKDLTQEMNVLNEQMKFIKGLRIRLENLDNSLEEIWTYLIGTSYNKERGDLLKNMNIQTNNFNYDIKAAGELLCR